MTFPLEAYKNKTIFEGEWHPSARAVKEIDVKTGQETQVRELNVLGRFVKAGVFNPYKSTEKNWVYDETIFCHIKINDAFNKDVAAHKVTPGTPQAQELVDRFPAAWVQFCKNCPKKAESEEEKAELEESPAEPEEETRKPKRK